MRIFQGLLLSKNHCAADAGFQPVQLKTQIATSTIRSHVSSSILCLAEPFSTCHIRNLTKLERSELRGSRPIGFLLS
jgi:hypothetical protein